MSVGRILRSRLPVGVSICLIATLGLPAVFGWAHEPAATASSAAAVPTGRMAILEAQQHLSSLGYDPGPTDGILGAQTRQAISAFERDRNRPVTGAATPEVLRLLRREVPTEQASTPAGTSAGESGDAPIPKRKAAIPEPGLAGTTWAFQDESGAAFVATFQPDGQVSSPGFGRGWSWEQDGQEIELSYGNRVGGLSTRTGRLVSGREIAGTGTSTRGREWTWRASRTR